MLAFSKVDSAPLKDNTIVFFADGSYKSFCFLLMQFLWAKGVTLLISI